MPTLPPAGGSADKPRSGDTTPPGSTSQHVDSKTLNSQKNNENRNREDVQANAVFSMLPRNVYTPAQRPAKTCDCLSCAAGGSGRRGLLSPRLEPRQQEGLQEERIMASRVKHSRAIGHAEASPERGRVAMPLKELDPPYQLRLREAFEGASSRRRLETHL